MERMQSPELTSFLTGLAERASEHGQFFGGWLPDDPGIRGWLRKELNLSGPSYDDTWTQLLISAVPRGSRVDADSQWRHLANRLGMSERQSIRLKALLWRTRALGALHVTAADGGRVEPVSVQAAAARSSERGLRLLHAEGAPAYSMGPPPSVASDSRRSGARSLDEEEDLLLQDLRRAGLPASGPAEIPDITSALDNGHVGEWPLAILRCPMPTEAAGHDFKTAGLLWNAPWPSGSEQGVLVTTRGYGIAYVASSRRFSDEERRWVVAQLMAAFVYYRIRQRELGRLGTRSQGTDALKDEVRVMGPVSLKAQFDLALFEQWPHITLALRIAMPPSAMRTVAITPEAQRAAAILSRELGVPMRVAEQRLRQLGG